MVANAAWMWNLYSIMLGVTSIHFRPACRSHRELGLASQALTIPITQRYHHNGFSSTQTFESAEQLFQRVFGPTTP